MSKVIHRLRSLAPVVAFLAVAVGLTACTSGGSTGPALKANPSSLSFAGVENKSLTIEWGGFGKVLAEDQHLTGTGSSNFEIIGGSNCVGNPPNGEYSSTRKTCTETIRLKNAVKSLNVTLEVTNQYDVLRVWLKS